MRPIHRMPTTPPRRPLIAKAEEMIRLAGTPSMRAMVKLVAAARIAMPSTVLLIIQANSARRITAAAMVIRLRNGVTAPRIVTVCEKISGSGTGRGRGEMNSRAAFCSSVEKAKEVISTAVTDLARTGRKAT